MYELLNMDCRAVLANMADDSVDSIVTDPPYHLTSIVKRFGPGQAPAQFGTDGAFARASRGFMGQTWDGGDIAFDPELWAECLRVLKPGGHLLAFSGSRTYHRMAYAIDVAGFEIRDMLEWLYGSGFPKSLDVSKAIDRAAGAERRVVAQRKGVTRTFNIGAGAIIKEREPITAPATPEAQQWAGWGTALKPAHEPICMARKSFRGSVADNLSAHGVGALNIDACRVETDESTARISGVNKGVFGADDRRGMIRGGDEGRFPANVLHDGSDEVLAGFPETTSGGYPAEGLQRKQGAVYGRPNTTPEQRFTTSRGSAARFFYCAKASKADRNVGGVPNVHPTVKPTELMRWLVRLVTPPGGLVFDPFTGSGSTGRAAILEGCRFVGAELTPEYVPIARARIDAAVNGK